MAAVYMGGWLRGADLTTSQYLREKTLKMFDSLKMFQAGKTALNVINLNRKKKMFISSIPPPNSVPSIFV